ncbi:MAG: MBL fold metallo-hydrolase [Actinomycetota bacterium]
MSSPSPQSPAGPRKPGPPTAAIVIGSVVVVGAILAFAMMQKPGPEPTPPASAPVTIGNLPAPKAEGSPVAPDGPVASNPPAEPSVIPHAPVESAPPRPGGTVSGKFTPPKPAVNPGDLPPDHPPITADEGTQVGIQWLGYSCFYIHTPGGVVVVTDPFDPKATGLPSPGIRGHLVTTSLPDAQHNFVQGVQPFLDEKTMKPQPLQVVSGQPKSQGDLRVRPLATPSGSAHVIEAGALRIAHLGGVRQPLNPTQISALGKVDILMLPVGGGLTPKQAVALTKAINPAIVIPMEFATLEMEGPAAKLPPADAFISASPYAVTRKDSDVMLISKTELPESTEIFLLRYGH